MFKKAILLISLSLLMVITPISQPASAFERQKTDKSNIVIYPKGLSIPQDIIQDLKDSNPDAGIITIYEYSEVPSVEDRTSQNSVSPWAFLQHTSISI